MAELRSVCGDLGWEDVQTYIQSGNIIARAAGRPAELEAELERAIRSRFGIPAAVVARSTQRWLEYIDENPYPEASRSHPNLVMLALSKAAPVKGAGTALLERATAGEQVAQVDDALWIHYAGGAGRSKLAGGVIDRLVGSPVTTRNWRTVLKLGELAGAAA